MNMSLTEETSSVDKGQRLLKQQLGFEVILLDANVSSTDEASSVSDMYTWNFSLISPDSNMSTTTSDFLHAT